MRRFWLATGALVLALAVAMLATLPTSLGFSLWHYNAGFALAVVAALALWPWLRTRRVTTLLMAFTGVPAIATGAAMLYTKQFPFKEWVTWWHVVTSFALVLAFLVHWAHNATRLSDLTRRLFTRTRPVGLTALGAWTLVLVAGGITWLPAPSERFTSENYLLLSSWAVLVGVAAVYGTWLVFRWPTFQARLARPPVRNAARGLVDTGLWLSHWLVILTGFALVYLAVPLRAGSLKYVSKWWHTATSVAFLAFVTLHIGFNARLLRAHARRVDGSLQGRGGQPPLPPSP